MGCNRLKCYDMEGLVYLGFSLAVAGAVLPKLGGIYINWRAMKGDRRFEDPDVRRYYFLEFRKVGLGLVVLGFVVFFITEIMSR